MIHLANTRTLINNPRKTLILGAKFWWHPAARDCWADLPSLSPEPDRKIQIYPLHLQPSQQQLACCKVKTFTSCFAIRIDRLILNNKPVSTFGLSTDMIYMIFIGSSWNRSFSTIPSLFPTMINSYNWIYFYIDTSNTLLILGRHLCLFFSRKMVKFQLKYS